MLPVGLVISLAGSRGYLNDQAGLVSILRGRRTRNHLNRLNRIGRDLVGENLALLIGDWLAVDRKRIGGMIAQPMEEAIGIRGYSGRRKRHQRAHGGGRAFQRQLLDHGAVNVGVQGGVIFHQVVSRDRNRGGRASYLQFDDWRDGDGGTYIYICRER